MSVFRFFVSTAAVGLCLFSANVANAQQIFVTSNTTINSDVSGNDVFVGKDDLVGFNTLPGTITLTVADPANIVAFGTNAPDGKFYIGINVFGDHKANISGGTVARAYSRDTSTVNITGGHVFNTSDYNTGTTNITGGTVGISSGYSTSTVNISGGSVVSAIGYNTSTTNISGGTITNLTNSHDTSTINLSGGNINLANGYETSIFNISGGSINNLYGNHESTINVSGGTITEIFARNNSIFNLTGGTIGASTIHQVNDTATVNFFGQSVLFSSASAETDPLTGADGVFYDVAWTRPDGVLVNTRYFNVNGDVNNATPQGTTFTFQSTVTAPEPGSIALFTLALPLIGIVRRRQVLQQ